MNGVTIGEVNKTSTPIVKVDSDMFNHLNLTGRKKYYDQGYYGQDVVVAVIDSGCTPHTEFAERLLPGVNLCTVGYCSPGVYDDHGHGTHVAGIIAGENCGVAPQARILPVKVLNAFGTGSVPDVIKAIRWCINWRGPKGEKVDIINMSLSSTADFFTGKSDLLADYEKAIKEAVVANIAVIVAAGNTGKEQILYPAYFKDVIAVGAVDVDKKVAYFTTQSDEVDVCQVGVDVLSASIDGTYIRQSGTSMAAPHVAGIAALIVSKYKALFKKPMPEHALYEMLKMNTLDIGIPGVDKHTGAGFCTLNPALKRIKIQMKPNDPNIIVNGVKMVSDAAPIVQPPGRFFAPVRFLVEAIGGQASFNQEKQEATFEIDL